MSTLQIPAELYAGLDTDSAELRLLRGLGMASGVLGELTEMDPASVIPRANKTFNTVRSHILDALGEVHASELTALSDAVSDNTTIGETRVAFAGLRSWTVNVTSEMMAIRHAELTSGTPKASAGSGSTTAEGGSSAVPDIGGYL